MSAYTRDWTRLGKLEEDAPIYKTRPDPTGKKRLCFRHCEKHSFYAIISTKAGAMLQTGLQDRTPKLKSALVPAG